MHINIYQITKMKDLTPHMWHFCRYSMKYFVQNRVKMLYCHIKEHTFHDSVSWPSQIHKSGSNFFRLLCNTSPVADDVIRAISHVKKGVLLWPWPVTTHQLCASPLHNAFVSHLTTHCVKLKLHKISIAPFYSMPVCVQTVQTHQTVWVNLT